MNLINQEGARLMHPVLKTKEVGATTPYHRMPTLLAGEIPGVQGMVRVWAPDMRNAKQCRMLLVGAVGLLVALLTFVPLPDWALLVSAALNLAGLAGCVGFLQRQNSSCVSADDAGLSVVLSRSSRDAHMKSILSYVREPGNRTLAMRWDEITIITRSGCFLQLNESVPFEARVFGMRSRSVDSLMINLAAYPRAVRQEIAELIVQKARLCPDPNQSGRFIRSDDETLTHETSIL